MTPARQCERLVDDGVAVVVLDEQRAAGRGEHGAQLAGRAGR